MTIASFMSVALGYVAGLIGAVFVAKYLVAMIILAGTKLEGAPRREVSRMATAGGFVGMLPALLLGTVLGGTLGARYGEMATMTIGFGKTGHVFGIVLGVALVVTLVMSLSIAAGAALGRWLAGRENDPEP